MPFDHLLLAEKIGYLAIRPKVSGANASALLYSLIETAKANGHEPYRYLTYLFTEFPKHDGCVDGLMPWDIDPVSFV